MMPANYPAKNRVIAKNQVPARGSYRLDLGVLVIDIFSTALQPKEFSFEETRKTWRLVISK